MVGRRRRSCGGTYPACAACANVCNRSRELGMASCSFSESLPDIADEAPHQPQNFRFPKRKFGKTKVVEHSFRSDWFKSWPWIVFCHICVKALKEGRKNVMLLL